MKKRLISLLLLFALLVTAMPVGVLSFVSSAEENTEMTADEYNALYVLDNIAYSIDFFKLNEYWSPDGHSYEIPIGPSDNKNYVDDGKGGTGKTFDFTVENNQFVYTITKTDANGTVTLDGTYFGEADANAAIAKMTPADGVTYTAVKGTELHAAWNRAVNDWIIADKNFFKQFLNFTNPSVSATNPEFYTNNAAFGTVTSNTRYRYARSQIDTLGDGYVQLLPYDVSYKQGSGLQVSPIDAMLGTAEIVSVLGDSLKGAYVLFNNMGFSPKKDEASGTYTITGSTARATKIETVNSAKPFSYEKPITLTYTMENGKVFIYNGTETVLDATYSITGDLSKSNYIGWGANSAETKVYAARYYYDVLTEKERAQNHFADMAKFFRLDVSEFAAKKNHFNLDDVSAYYNAFATLNFDSTREEAQAVADAAYAALDAELSYPDFELEDYNALYVSDNLLYSLDFYKLNEYWCSDGNHGYVIPTGPADNNNYVDDGVGGTGKTFDFTKAENRVDYTITKTVGETITTLSGTYLGLDDANAAIDGMTKEEGATYTAVKGTTLNKAWGRAMSDWVTADGDFFKNFNNTPDSKIAIKTQNSFTVNDARLDMARSAVASLENGYITLPQTYYGSGLSINANHGQIKTFEMVSVLGSNIKTDNYILMNSVYVRITKKPGNTFYISENNNPKYVSFKGSVTLGNPEAPHYASYDKLTTLTYTMSGGTGSGTFEMFDGAEKVMSVEYEPGTSGIGSGNYIGYGTSLTGAKLYAVRYYSDILDAEERAQNHFADIAKFYRLDISEYIKCLPLCKDADVVNFYNEFASLTLEDTRGEVEAIAKAAIAELKATIKLSDKDEEYYNSLYVSDNLMYSIDFYKLNEYWCPDGNHDYVIPTGPADNDNYVDNGKNGTGKTFDFTVENNRFVYTVTKTDANGTITVGEYLGEVEAMAAIEAMPTAEGVTYKAEVKMNGANKVLNAAWGRAVDAWKVEDKAFFLNFRNTSNDKYYYATQDSAFGTASGGDRHRLARSAIGTIESGYITMPSSGRMYTSSGLILGGSFGGEIKTLEMISELGQNIGSNYLLINSLYLAAKKDNVTKTFYISGNGNSDFLYFTNAVNGSPAPYDSVTTLTYNVDVSGVAGDTGDFVMYNGADKLLEAGLTVGAKGLAAGNYFGFYGSLVEGKIYAARYYSDILTKDERAQNHFADIAKWFRLDIDGIESYTQAEKQRIYEAFASYTIGDATYIEAQKAYNDITLAITIERYEAHYLTGDEYKLHNTFIDACIEKYRKNGGTPLSLDAIYSIPLSARGDIYALSGDSLTQEAITDAVSAYWSFDEEKYRSYDSLYYNDGNLVIAYDFFALNSYWNAERVADYLPADTSVTSWESLTCDGVRCFDRFSVKGRLAILHESDETPFAVPAGAHRGNGGFLLFGGNNRPADGLVASGLSDSKKITLEAVLRTDVANEKLFSLSGISLGVIDGVYTSPSGLYNVTASSGVGAAATLGTTSAYTLTATNAGLGKAASIKLSVDGVDVLFAEGTAMEDVKDIAVFGQSNSFAGAVYAIRYYRTELTAEQKAQNHFADIAKFYRLDLQDIDLILCSEEAASELYAEMADCDFDGQRADIQNIYDSFRNAFLSENSTLGELRAEANEIVTFEGYQVRISGTENEATNAYAGMRAIFIVDPDIVTDLESKGYTVKVDVITRNAQLDHTLCGKPVAIPIYNGASYAAKKQTIDGVGECYVVTVLYASGTDGNRVPLTDERVAELISFEVAYEYAITLTKDGHTYVFTSTAESERFGNTVNAKELYSYFGKEGNDEMQGLHKNDSLVKKMLLLIPEETAIEEARIGKLVLSANAEAQYKVTVPENITDTDLAAIEGFVTELDALTGAEFETVEETATRCDREIVIANGSTRADASEFATASASAGYSYAIGVSGERILVYASDSLALSDALSVLLASVTDNKTDDAKNDNLDKFYLPAMLSVNNLGSSTASVSDFTVVLPSSMDTAHRNLVNEYITSLASRTGITLTVVSDDKAVSGRRILVKTSADNEAAAAIFEDSSYTGYEIIAAGDDILVSAYSDIALRASLSALVASVSDNGVIPTDITLKCDFGLGEGVPHLATNGTLAGNEIYDANENNYVVAYSDVTEAEYLAYCTLLAENGFEKVADNEINENLFATYKSQACSIILSFYPSTSDMKIIIQTNDTFLPTGEAAPYKKNASVTPSVTLMDHELCSYVMQLEDGSFIIVDGGDLNRRGAMDKMWDHLTSLAPEGEKPVISLWMLTHGHQDHVLLFVDFIAKYKDDMVLKAVAFNFPLYESFDMSEEIYTYQGPGIATCAPRVYDVLDRYYPDVERWIPRTGQKYSVAGAEIEILFSHEDYYPARTSNGNDTSSTWRITLGDTSVVYLGDLTDARCKWMASVYGETLESDILQVTHHGVSGGDLGLYQLIDPKICFWGTSADRFESDQCKGIGAYTSYTYNNWVRTTDWTRTVNGEEVSGARAHYHGSVRTTITLPLS
ncbi:MAG: hypothetical protein E7587_01465 [Ruminococcaceae bacterium]|nr:hypothetical protein [Oscillospiraceae bacterium]